jgi:hypothetical protein
VPAATTTAQSPGERLSMKWRMVQHGSCRKLSDNIEPTKSRENPQSERKSLDKRLNEKTMVAVG